MTGLALRTASPEETRAVGAALAGLLEPGDVVLLSGELGAGKTTLVKGVVAALGGGEAVTSPTFTLCHLYATTPPVAHVDCWRLQRVGEALDLALEELLDDGAVALVEWGEALAPLYGRWALRLCLNPLAGEEDGRELVIAPAGGGGGWEERLSELALRLRAAGLAA